MTVPQPNPYGPPPTDAPPSGPPLPPYGQPGHGQPGHGAPGYGAPGYGAPGYGAPGPGGWYGPAWGPPPLPAAWPYGPGRPAAATAAGVLGIVTGGLTALACVFFLIVALTGDGDATSVLLLVLGVPCAVGTISGGIRLLAGHRRGILLGSALGSVGVLLLALIVGATLNDGNDLVGITVWVVLALPLPIVTAVMAAHHSVKGWTEGTPPY